MDITLNNIFAGASPDVRTVNITFPGGISYSVIVNGGQIIGARGSAIAFDPTIRARFTDRYNELKSMNPNDFNNDPLVKTWHHDYVIGIITDIMTSGEIESYNYLTTEATDDPANGPIIYCDSISYDEAINEAVDEANARVDEFTRIGIENTPMDAIFFRISDGVDMEKFVATDVNRLILLASQGSASLYDAIIKSGGFKLSEVYGGIANDVHNNSLQLVNRDGDSVVASNATQQEEPTGNTPYDVPQYETVEAHSDDNVNTVDRLTANDEQPSSYANANGNDYTETANRLTADTNDSNNAETEVIEDTAQEQSANEESSDSNVNIEPAGNDDDNIENDSTNEVHNDEPEEEQSQPTDDVNNDEIIEDGTETVNETPLSEEPTDTAAPEHADETEHNDEPVVADDTDDKIEPAPSTSEFHVPDIQLPTLTTTEFKAVQKNPVPEQNEDENVNNDANIEPEEADETQVLPAHGDYDNDGVANAVDSNPYDASDNAVISDDNDDDITETNDNVEEEPQKPVEIIKPDAEVEALFSTDNLNNELDELESRKNSLNSSIEGKIAEQNDRAASINETKRHIGDLKSQASRLEGMLEHMQHEYDSHAHDVDNVNNEIKSIDDRTAVLTNRAKWLVKAQQVLKEAGLL